MSTNKHTPGPWATAPAFPDQVYSVPEFERAKRETPEANPYDESLIVETAGNEANARLIAAAPDLLEACEALLRDHLATIKLKPEEVKGGIGKQAMDAIHKAKGDS